MNGYWQHPTRIGLARIVFFSGAWHAAIGEESLGAYSTPEQALDDLANGTTYWPSCGTDPSTLGMPDELGDWEFIPI